MNPIGYIISLVLVTAYSKFVGESLGRSLVLMFLMFAAYTSWTSFFSLGSGLGLIMGILSIVGILVMVYSFLTDRPEPEDKPWENI